MSCLYFTHPACGKHDAGPHHPERPERIPAIHDRLTTDGLLDQLTQSPVTPASIDAMRRAHVDGHVGRIQSAAPTEGRVSLDPDTAMNPASLDAALAAAGAATGAVDAVLDGGQATRAFCNIRPPGHHAERNRAMGFCLFNNVALAAFRALDAFGLARVAILDFDVHHGNGTEDVVRGERRLLYASSFQYPLFPFPSLDGEPGHIVKTPLSAGADSNDFRTALERDWLDTLARQPPELVLFSAGFDAHSADPLAGLELTEDDFAWVTRAVIDAVGREVPVVSLLEGGYDLDALGRSAAAHVRVLAGIDGA